MHGRLAVGRRQTDADVFHCTGIARKAGNLEIGENNDAAIVFEHRTAHFNLFQVCAARNRKLHIILGALRSAEHVHRRKVDALAANFGNMRCRMPAAAAKIARPIGLNETASRNMGLKRTKEREIHGRFAAVNLDADAAGQITRKLLINTNQRIGRNFGREKYFWGGPPLPVRRAQRKPSRPPAQVQSCAGVKAKASSRSSHRWPL